MKDLLSSFWGTCHTSKKWGGKSREFQESELNQSYEIIIQNIAPNFQPIESNFQSNEQEVQPIEQNIQNDLKSNPSRALVSSKVESNVSNNEDIVTSVPKANKSHEYYEALYKDNDTFTTLTAIDIRWLDDHITVDGRTIL